MAPMTQYLEGAQSGCQGYGAVRVRGKTYIKLIPTDPLCAKIVDVVANTPVPTIRLTIKKVTLVRPSCLPCGRSDSATDAISASTSPGDRSWLLPICDPFSSPSLALMLGER